MALHALQTATILFEDHLALTKRTNKDIQQFLADWHGIFSLSTGWLIRCAHRLEALEHLAALPVTCAIR